MLTATRNFLDRYLDAWNAHDPAAVARHMAASAIYEDVALGRVLHGPSEIAKFVEEATRSSSDFRFEVVSLFMAAATTRTNGSCSRRTIGRCPAFPRPAAPFVFEGHRLESSIRAGSSSRIGTTTTSPRCSRSLAFRRPPRRRRKHMARIGILHGAPRTACGLRRRPRRLWSCSSTAACTPSIFFWPSRRLS